ncbi:hypothetical protein ABEB36_007432 [Hypothenemus hampei]|uniref:Uncharacterized protein n=1 Tax=Hypothenemus hampei TaxID=57062 RepID=A0ABD1EXY4_HYPHA
MNFNASLLGRRWMVLFGLLLEISVVFSGLDFTSCGGDPVSTFEIDGCNSTPCALQLGSSYHIQIQPQYINPQVDTVDLYIGVIQYGAYMEQNSTVTNPCIYVCPITTRLDYPMFDVYLNISTRLVQMSSEVQLHANYYTNSIQKIGLCVKFNAGRLGSDTHFRSEVGLLRESSNWKAVAGTDRLLHCDVKIGNPPKESDVQYLRDIEKEEDLLDNIAPPREALFVPGMDAGNVIHLFKMIGGTISNRLMT